MVREISLNFFNGGELMKKASVVLMSIGLLAFLLSAVVVAEEGAHQYVGSAKCKTCHKAEKKVAQYVKWQEGKHSKAYEVLASEAAIAIGKEKGIENPQTSDQCLKCHVTAFGVAAELKAESFDQTEGVGCETCHGPGSDYKKMAVMKDREASIAAGMIIPTEETCTGCHNEESPTFEKFDFAEASKIIAHPNPDKEEATEE
jgi:hypothetical protein